MVDLLKTFFSKEMKMKIDEYLFKMKSTKFLSELNLDLNSNDISLKSYSIHYLENLKSIWLEVANLSVNLFVDYEFFRQFSFPNRYKSQIYEERLKKLGYKRHKGIWKIDQIPNEQCIIENIFYSYIYMFLCKEKKIEIDNEKFINENARNSLKLKMLCNPIRNNINVNDTINEEITYGNIDHSVPPIIGEMGNNDIEVLDPYRDKESILNTPINASNNATCSNLNSTLQKSEMISEKEISSSNSKIKSNLSSSQWICNACSYNQNNGCKINCEVCMSSKFAKINSCVFESSSEASNENRIEHDANNADNKDKWTCKQCTFNNRISVDLCEICLEQNINKIGPINDNELPEETWYCKICGENNLFECYKCKNCRVPAEFFNKWRCGQCSYYNDKVAKHCAVCYIENPYLIKCNLCAKNLVNKKYDKICKKCRILAERCTNKETIDYQDNGKIQSKMSESEKVSDKRYQRRNKINANQTLTINVSQNTETKGQHSIVDRKINNEETGNSKKYNIINKTPSDTSKFYNSSPAGDENSGNPEENPIKLKKNVSQKSERKQIFSSIGGAPNYEKTDNLTIYKVDKTQSEISESNKSLSKGDQNSGKLNKNQIKSNEFNQQKPGTKRQTPPVVKAINKINSKPCKNCKSKVCTNNQHWCDKCEYSQWYCQNEACDGINFTNEYCKQCTARKGSDFSNCANFWVMKDCKEVQMWQCEFCLQFIAGTLMKCNKCRNYRNLPNYIKCKCNWNNLNIRKKCDKCNADLIKIIKL